MIQCSDHTSVQFVCPMSKQYVSTVLSKIVQKATNYLVFIDTVHILQLNIKLIAMDRYTQATHSLK